MAIKIVWHLKKNILCNRITCMLSFGHCQYWKCFLELCSCCVGGCAEPTLDSKSSLRSWRSHSMQWTLRGAILYWWQMGDWGPVTKSRDGGGREGVVKDPVPLPLHRNFVTSPQSPICHQYKMAPVNTVTASTETASYAGYIKSNTKYWLVWGPLKCLGRNRAWLLHLINVQKKKPRSDYQQW